MTTQTEQLIPQSDWIVLKLLEHEEKTPGGLVLPKLGKDYSNLKQEKYQREHTPDRDIQKDKSRDTNRYEVLAIGPGSYVDVADDIRDQVFLRKPMSIAVGDIVLVQEGAVPCPVAGEVLYMAHEYCVLAKIIKNEEGKDLISPTLDYVFFKQAESMAKSKGGIYTPGSEDHTGTSALPNRYEVLGVGDGPWALRQEKGKIPEFARRPMCVKEGDIFNFEGAGFFVSVAGAIMGVVQNYQIAARFA